MRGKILIIVSLLASSFVMNSCLKDDVGLDWTDSLKGKMYAEVWKGGFTALGLAPIPDSVTFKFLVNIATDQPPTEDITVTMAVSEEAMNRYNDAKGTAYKLYPYIDIVDKNLVIKAGTRNAYCHVKVWNAQLLNACDNYMAPIIIESATGGVIPADPLNMGARFMGLPISNPFAGSYHCLAYTVHPTAGLILVDQNETFTTVNCSTVIKTQAGFSSSLSTQVEITSNTMVVLGVTCNQVIVHVIDPTTGVNYDAGEGMFTTFTGDPTAPPAAPSSDVNYYNPVTKTFVLNFWYNSSAQRKVYEILTKL